MEIIDLHYIAYKIDESNIDKEDVLYLIRAISKAVHERGMTFGGGSTIRDDGRLLDG